VADEAMRTAARSFWAYEGINPRRHTLAQMALGNVVTGCASLCNRALADRLVGTDSGKSIHDHWAAMHAAALGSLVVVDQPLVRYRQRDGNVVGAVSVMTRVHRRVKQLLRGRNWEASGAPDAAPGNAVRRVLYQLVP
jgi:hypothetical protein